MNKRLRWSVGIALIVAGIGGLAFWAVASPGALSYYKTPTEAITERPQQTLRIGGRVRDLDRRAGFASFVLTDGRSSVRVSYRGEVPDTLKNGTDGIAQGRLHSDGRFVASGVQAKCSSKYVPKKDRETQLGKA